MEERVEDRTAGEGRGAEARHLEQGKRPSRRRFILLAAGGAALVILVVATIVSLILHGRGEVADARGERPAHSVALQARDFAFVPQAVEVSANQRLAFILSGAGLSHHTFTIRELGVDVVLAPGQTETIAVNPTTSEKITFFCRYHHADGMQGFLQVV